MDRSVPLEEVLREGRWRIEAWRDGNPWPVGAR